MLCVIASKVFRAGSPVDDELALTDTVLDPIKMHIHGFGAFLFDAVIGDASRSAGVNLDGRRRLRLAEFGEVGV